MKLEKNLKVIVKQKSLKREQENKGKNLTVMESKGT